MTQRGVIMPQLIYELIMISSTIAMNVICFSEIYKQVSSWKIEYIRYVIHAKVKQIGTVCWRFGVSKHWGIIYTTHICDIPATTSESGLQAPLQPICIAKRYI